MFLSGKWKLPIRRFSGSQYFQVLTNKKISAKIQPPKNLPKIKLKIENLQKKIAKTIEKKLVKIFQKNKKIKNVKILEKKM